MIVMKFGGTSVGSAERIGTVLSIVKKHEAQHPVVVISALSGVTDMLLKLAKDAITVNVSIEEIMKRHYEVMSELGLPKDILNREFTDLRKILNGIFLLKEVSPRTLDNIASFGEIMSSKLIAAAGQKIVLNAVAHTSCDVGMITNDDFTKAEILPKAYELLANSLIKMEESNEIPIITGFIGKTESGDITTLGRGGSDYSAAIIGAAVNAKEIQIWTDVDGVMTADPRIVKNARNVPIISFDEASELAYFGAKVLHPKTIIPAMNKKIPVRVLNTQNPAHPGTLILSEVKNGNVGVKAIASKKGVTVINIASTRMFLAYGFLSEVFRIFKEQQVAVDMIATSEVSISLTVDKDANIENILKQIHAFAEIYATFGTAIISVVGSGLRNHPGIAGKIFGVLGENNINTYMISQGASEINISFVVKESDADKAVQVLHDALFE